VGADGSVGQAEGAKARKYVGVYGGGNQ